MPDEQRITARFNLRELIFSQVQRSMIIGSKVEVMSSSNNQKQAASAQRKVSLSPELKEFLHMLSSLEAELKSKASASH